MDWMWNEMADDYSLNRQKFAYTIMGSEVIAWLFNAENFFNAMSEWLKDGDGV